MLRCVLDPFIFYTPILTEKTPPFYLLFFPLSSLDTINSVPSKFYLRIFSHWQIAFWIDHIFIILYLQDLYPLLITLVIIYRHPRHLKHFTDKNMTILILLRINGRSTTNHLIEMDKICMSNTWETPSRVQVWNLLSYNVP